MELLVTNRNFDQTMKFWSNIELLVTNRIFCQKSKFSNRNFNQNDDFLQSWNTGEAQFKISEIVIIHNLNFERFYSIASGQTNVIVRNIYMTNLDRVTCTGDYERVQNNYTTAIYQSCDVKCHEECASGCNVRDDPRDAVF